jgi:hypothetical protein
MVRTQKIYAIICPKTGNPVYVGKNSQTLAARLRAHKGMARRHPDTAIHRWMRECFSQGLGMTARILEEVGLEESGPAERRWVALYSEDYKLLNQAPAGAGNPGVGRISWTREILARLGTEPDSQIAADLGCERKTVTYRRASLGIAASYDRTKNKPPPNMGGWNKIALPQSVIEALGTLPDAALGFASGVSKKRIIVERHKRGIASYATTTGNDGRIKLGEPHRRWIKQRKYAPSPAPKVAS